MFVDVTVTIVQCSYILMELLYLLHLRNIIIIIKQILTLLLTIVEMFLLIQYLYTKIFVHGVFDHILKVVDACKNLYFFLKGM